MASLGRVLILNERDLQHPTSGGAEVHVFEIFERLVKRGFEVTLKASRAANAKKVEYVKGLRVERLGRLAIYYPRVIATTLAETRRGEYDVVVECLNKVPYYAPVYSAAPVLALCHHLFGEVAFQQVPWPVAAAVFIAERPIPWIYRSTPFITISESSREDLIARGLSASQISVSHCGIRRPELRVDPNRPRPQRVSYVGRLEPYKNVDVMLRAMKQIADRFPTAEIEIIGRGSARPSLERLVHELGIEDRTTFLGFVSDEERDRRMASSRVCVFPSDKEGWGLTVIEANAVGTPVVASDAPGLRDSVRHGETGLLAPTGDVSAFAHHIAELLENDETAREMSAAALEWSAGFSWDRAADEMAEAIVRAGRHS
jgi:glycosyltransferase involved in cell wall biosynthesis